MKLATENKSQPHPLLIGLHAARANFVPGLIVQSVMVAVVAAYYFYAPAQAWLARLALLKERWGYGFACVSGIVAGAFLPELLAVIVFQRGRVKRENFERLLFNIFYWGSQSMVVDALYRFQAVLFGAQVDWPTVAKKVLVDQFIYSPIYSSPFAMACYAWKNNGYRRDGMRRVLTLRFFKETTFPALVASWGVWIPVVCLVYSLPPLLQVPLFSLALTFWSMQLTWIGRKKEKN